MPLPSPSVVALFISAEPAGPLQSVPSVQAIKSRGLAGDRYCEGRGTFSDKVSPARQVTLIEREAIEAIGRDQHMVIDPAESRRNILTQGVALNHLVGREFSVGQVRLRGIKLCEPCGHLEKLTGRNGLSAALLHRAGLNAEVLTDGTIRVSDPITVD